MLESIFKASRSISSIDIFLPHVIHVTLSAGPVQSMFAPNSQCTKYTDISFQLSSNRSTYHVCGSVSMCACVTAQPLTGLRTQQKKQFSMSPFFFLSLTSLCQFHVPQICIESHLSTVFVCTLTASKIPFVSCLDTQLEVLVGRFC